VTERGDETAMMTTTPGWLMRWIGGAVSPAAAAAAAAVK